MRQNNTTPPLKEQLYYVRGMHCASCEIVIEKKLLEINNIKSVEASTAKGTVLIEYENQKPETKQLNQLFKKEGYIFSEQPLVKTTGLKKGNTFLIIVIALILIIAFVVLNKSGLASLINVNNKSSLPTFFFFGLLAGISSCAALIGGLVLSLSKQWSELYKEEDAKIKKFQPHLLFNLGRLLAYGLLGAFLGFIGNKLQLSLNFTAILVVIVSGVMVLLGLQMLGIKKLRRFQLGLPKFITRYIADEKNFKGRWLPFILGALTFFLPCGFTITAQGLALLSGSAVQGGLIMLFFALGTLPTLLLIGFSSVEFLKRPHLSNMFLKIAGVLILFFAIFNINAQLNVLGAPSLSGLKVQSKSFVDNSLPPLINGKQIIKMQASSSGYSPNYLKVKAGIPVRWEITDVGTSGCTNAVISRSLFDGEIPLTPGQTSIKEFTPEKPGRYKFSCWMGMISGIIEVVGNNEGTTQNNINNRASNFTQSGGENSGGSCSLNGSCGCGGR